MRAMLLSIFAIGILGSMMSHMNSHRSPGFEQLASDQSDSGGPEAVNSASEAQPTPLPDGAINLQRDQDGHYYADVDINGASIHMIVDTGATVIALSRDDARKAGIATSIGMNDVVGQGADGSIHGEVVSIDRMRLGEKTAEHMDAIVLNSGGQSLLGQSFLSKFASVEIHGDTMSLR